MSVYVDNARIPARAGNITGRWSHLTADTQEELHAFAERIGLRRAWFQDRCKSPLCRQPCVHWHYDVTEGRRQAALAAGAVDMDIRKWAELVRARRAAARGGGG